MAGGLLIFIAFAAGSAVTAASRSVRRAWANRPSDRVGVVYRWMNPNPTSHGVTTQLPTQAETTGWCPAWENELEAILRGSK